MSALRSSGWRSLVKALTAGAVRAQDQHMIAHHQRTVQIAEVQLKYGKRPELLKMAKDIIKARQ